MRPDAFSAQPVLRFDVFNLPTDGSVMKSTRGQIDGEAGRWRSAQSLPREAEVNQEHAAEQKKRRGRLRHCSGCARAGLNAEMVDQTLYVGIVHSTGAIKISDCPKLSVREVALGGFVLGQISECVEHRV